MLIGVGIIAAKGCCSEPQTNEDRPLMSYDFLIKKDEKKDGLDVYKPKSIIHHRRYSPAGAFLQLYPPYPQRCRVS